MANWLAISWENNHFMFLTAKVAQGNVTVEQAQFFSFADLSKRHENGETVSFEALTQKIGAIVHDQKLAKSDTVVVLRRSDAEVRPMVFPPVPLDDLPDMVRFQAIKEFNGYDPSDPLDFFVTNKLANVSRSTLFPTLKKGQKAAKPVVEMSHGPKHVLAATIRATTYHSVHKHCEPDRWNLDLKRIVLRPCETASLWRRFGDCDPNRTYLLVEIEAAETTQTVLHQGEPVFIRSPKISSKGAVDSDDFASQLVAELKRTRIAVRNEIQGVSVDEIILCGTGKRFEPLLAKISEGLGVEAHLFDPWMFVTKSSALTSQMPEYPERFVSLIGAVWQAGQGMPSQVDFCNPKKRAEKTGNRQLMNIVVAAILLVTLLLTGYGYYLKSQLQQTVISLSNKKAELERKTVDVPEKAAQLKALDEWLKDDVNWFEELHWLSRSLPKSEQLVVQSLDMTAAKGGSMELKVSIKDGVPLEEQLRDSRHEIKPGAKTTIRNSQYQLESVLSVFLSKESAKAVVEAEQPPQPVTPVPEPTPEPTPSESSANSETSGEPVKTESSKKTEASQPPAS